MPPLKPSLPPLRHLYGIRIAPRSHRCHPARTLSSTTPRCQTTQPIPYIQTCPSPTCSCAPTPPDLDIDRKTPLMHTMPSYAQQVLISTGKDDWTSRVEDEQGDAGDFVQGMKSVMGRGSPGFDPFNNVLLTLSSFPTPAEPKTTTALLFPSFRRLSIPHIPTAFAAFASAYLKAPVLHPMHAALTPAQKALLTRDESAAASLPPPEPISRITVLICGHGGRDARCGVMGPLLRMAFTTEFERKGVEADVGLISHIGGHKFAGNVIVYIPPGLATDGVPNALAGCGVWYGRVGPENVEGVVGETIMKGRVIEDLFRGGITRDGEMLGRMLEAQMKNERCEDDTVANLKPRARR